MAELDDLVREFIEETAENLDRSDRDLAALGQDPTDGPRLASVFRTVHTIKGTCGFLGFENLGQLSHNAEELLDALREGELSFSPEIASILLATFDRFRAYLECLAGGGSDAAAADYGRDGELKEELDRLAHSLASEPASTADAPCDEPASRSAPPGANGQPSASALITATPDPLSGTLRVDVKLVDRLMDLVGELVLTRNQMLRFAAEDRDGALAETAGRLDHVTTELQARVMRTRMQPISTVWRLVPRLVRDLCQHGDKQVEIQIEGSDAELDKTVIEAIRDPLIHIVRNAVDHGIETPEDRSLLGKPEAGTILLRASHEAGQVNIEISDDGRGMDVGVIRERAIERGLMSPQEAGRMNREEILQFVFLPGFSTARTITTVSGRGVGMDVVKTNIEAIGGTIELRNRPGSGTTVAIQIPLTLAIVPALVIEDGGDRFAIPQVHLRELLSIGAGEGGRGIEMVDGVPVYRLRGRLLPLVWLTRVLRQPNAQLTTEVAQRLEEVSRLVVLDAGGCWFGLIVDRIGDPEEIVVKPLGAQLAGIPVYSGATIMGDGAVALILDVLGLAKSANIAGGVEDQEVRDLGLDDPSDEPSTPYLLVEVTEQRRAAMQLDCVERLDSWPISAVERTSSGEFVQYRGDLMPLHRLSEMLGIERSDVDDCQRISVVIACCGVRTIGIIVEAILDVVHDDVVVHDLTGLRGVVGSAVLAGRVTEMIDLERLIDCLGEGDLAMASLEDL